MVSDGLNEAIRFDTMAVSTMLLPNVIVFEGKRLVTRVGVDGPTDVNEIGSQGLVVGLLATVPLNTAFILTLAGVVEVNEDEPGIAVEPISFTVSSLCEP